MNNDDDDLCEASRGLPPEYRAIMRFETAWPQHNQIKVRAIHTEFGFGPARYYQLLNAAVDHPRAADDFAELASRWVVTRRARRLRRLPRTP